MVVWQERHREALKAQAARRAERQPVGESRLPHWARQAEARKAATAPAVVASTKAKQPEPKPEPPELVIVDAEPHYVDGEPVYR
jgi:hypothetical protein